MEIFEWFKEEFDKIKDTEELKQAELENWISNDDIDETVNKHFWELS